jgi:uncharacterized membrane protein
MKNQSIITTAFILAGLQLTIQPALADSSPNPVGKCYGVVGKEEGDCGGKNPATGESWSCAGQNPTADLGWKKMKKSQCEITPKSPDAARKRFEANS